MAQLPDNKPLLCYITDRTGVADGEILPLIERAVAAGVNLIQIRERDLSTHALLTLVEAAVARARGTATRILVNDRLDVALTAGAGLHLPTHGFQVAYVRRDRKSTRLNSSHSSISYAGFFFQT